MWMLLKATRSGACMKGIAMVPLPFAAAAVQVISVMRMSKRPTCTVSPTSMVETGIRLAMGTGSFRHSARHSPGVVRMKSVFATGTLSLPTVNFHTGPLW